MNDRMISFLKHIHIENIDDFDIDFEMVGRNRFRPEQIDMVIVKKTPWKYHLLREFQDALNTLTYPYMLRFSYLVRPDINDLIRLHGELRTNGNIATSTSYEEALLRFKSLYLVQPVIKIIKNIIIIFFI